MMYIYNKYDICQHFIRAVSFQRETAKARDGARVAPNLTIYTPYREDLIMGFISICQIRH